MQKHFVTFLSPGTFVSEETTRPIKSWHIPSAVRMARKIVERYGAKPYGFFFETRSRGKNDLDSKVIKSSGIYYLGGSLRTAEQVLNGTDPKEKILRSNVLSNNIKTIIDNYNSWRFTSEFRDKDTLLDVKL